MGPITRKEYMKNSSELFRPYYRQFVTSETLAFVKNRIGMEKLRRSTCEHLNDVVMWERGGRTWLWDHSPINLQLARELGEVSPNALPSQSTRTCIGKAAARILLGQPQ